MHWPGSCGLCSLLVRLEQACSVSVGRAGGLLYCGHGVSPCMWSGSVGCHCTFPSDAVVTYRDGGVVPDVGCFFCYLTYLHALVLEFQS